MAQRATPVAKGAKRPAQTVPTTTTSQAVAVARGRPQRDLIETVWTLFCSVKFAVVQNVALALAAMLGTIIPQLQPGVADFQDSLDTFLDTARQRYGDLTGFLHW